MSRIIFFWIFVSTGALLIAISVFASNQNWEVVEAITLNLGVVSISVVLVDYLWRVIGGDPVGKQVDELANRVTELSHTVDIVSASKSAGLRTVYDCQGNYGGQADWETIISSASGNVDIMGRTLFGWTRSQQLDEIIVRKVVDEGLRFRWLIMSVENKYLPMLQEEKVHIGPMLTSKIEEVKTRLSSIASQIPEDKQGLFQVRMFDDVPLYCGIIRAGDLCFVTPYLCGSASDASPMFSVEHASGPWGKTYSREFSSIWENSRELEGSQS